MTSVRKECMDVFERDGLVNPKSNAMSEFEIRKRNPQINDEARMTMR